MHGVMGIFPPTDDNMVFLGISQWGLEVLVFNITLYPR